MRRLLPTSFDSFVRESIPSTNFRDEKYLVVNATATDERRGFLHFSLPDLGKGATIVSATLLLTLKDSWPGANTVTARRVTESWKEGGINWNNQPATTATHAATGAVAGGIDLQTLVIDVAGIVQDWANSPRQVFGIRLTGSAAAQRRIYSSEAVRRQVRPQLAIEWAVPPDEPVNLRPNGEGVAVSEAAPLLLWDSDQPFETQVQIDPAPEDFGVSVLYDSGWVANSEMAFDTALAAVPPNLANNTSYWWRVRIRDANGVASEWSDAAEFSRRTKGSLAITSPGSGIDVETTTPVIEHTFTGRTQQEIEYTLFEDGILIYTNRRFPSTETEFELPQGLITSDTAVYTVTIRVWDTFRRRTIGNDSAYVEASREFQFAPEAGIDPVTSFAIADAGGHVLMTWNRSVEPDYFALRVDGRIVFDRLDPDDLFISGTSYGLAYFRAEPREEAVYRIEAIENDSGVLKHSTSNPEEALTFSPLGIWLVDELESTEVLILGHESPTAELGEAGGVFFPLGSRSPVHVRDGRRGWEGTVSGTLETKRGIAASEWRERLEELYGRDHASLRLIYATRNHPVEISGLQMPVSPLPQESYEVAFDYEQSGEFTVEDI